jgi:type IV secretory pathway VirB10-like protein
MKNNLRMLVLALCMLPMYLHAGTGKDLKQVYQPSQEQNTRSAESIPAGTVIPVSLNSILRSDKSGSGTTIIATVMQDVPLGAGETLRKGSKVTGHVIEAVVPGNRSRFNSIK